MKTENGAFRFYLLLYNIGMRFALIKIKRGLAEIISRYEVSPCKETQIPIKYNTKVFGLLITKDPIKLSFKTIE